MIGICALTGTEGPAASPAALSLDDWDMRSDRNGSEQLVGTRYSLDDWDMRSDRNVLGRMPLRCR